MEPRARAGKNVGKETFPAKELEALLYSYGDVEQPLPESVRVMDEILTDFLAGCCFEANQHASYAGRQKLKFDDFEFSLRRNNEYLGKVKTMIDKRVEIKKMRQAFQGDDDTVVKNAKDTKDTRAGGEEELLGDDDDDAEIEEFVRNKQKESSKKKKRKLDKDRAA